MGVGWQKFACGWPMLVTTHIPLIMCRHQFVCDIVAHPDPKWQQHSTSSTSSTSTITTASTTTVTTTAPFLALFFNYHHHNTSLPQLPLPFQTLPQWFKPPQATMCMERDPNDGFVIWALGLFFFSFLFLLSFDHDIMSNCSVDGRDKEWQGGCDNDNRHQQELEMQMCLKL